MAKTAAAPNAAAEPETKARVGKKSWVVIGLVGLVASAGGAALPMAFRLDAHTEGAEAEEKPKGDLKQALVPFDSVVVNVADGRFTRYLRVRIVLVVEKKGETAALAQMEKEKPFLQTWVVGYLQDKTMEQLHGSAGMNRVRREVRDEFNRRLFGGGEKIRDILLPEYNFQ